MNFLLEKLYNSMIGSKLKDIRILLIFCLLFHKTFPGFAQLIPNEWKVKKSVVKISTDEGVGVGVIVGQEGRSLYILTARHVVQNESGDFSENIKINLFDQVDEIPGRAIEIDLGLPYQYDLSLVLTELKSYKQYSFIQISELKRISDEGQKFSNNSFSVIGHPFGGRDFQLLGYERMNEYKIRLSEFTFRMSRNHIRNGCSGGPVLDQNGNWVGMVLSIDGNGANCLKMVDIIGFMSEAAPISEDVYPSNYETLYSGEMILIKGGRFLMGGGKHFDGDREYIPFEERPLHKVSVKGFYLGKYEVTVAQFRRFIESSNYRPKPEGSFAGETFWISQGQGIGRKKGMTWEHNEFGEFRETYKYNHPVIYISWHDAKAYCEWLSEITGYEYRLPTESEWEYAAGGGEKSRTLYAGTNNISNLGYFGNLCDQTCPAPPAVKSFKDKFPSIAPVGSYRPNTLGIYDMTGNVWEWCEDRYHENYNNAPEDGSAWIDKLIENEFKKDYRIHRGGSWNREPITGKVSFRGSENENEGWFSVGFRVARTL